jgi:hypothetical protein
MRGWGKPKNPRGFDMKGQKNKDLETLSLFLILGALTLVVVFVLKVVLFGPGFPPLIELGMKP